MGLHAAHRSATFAFIQSRNMHVKKIIGVLLPLALLMSSCGKNYDVPATYTFDNVNYSGQTIRITMLDEMIGLAETGNAGVTVSGQTLKNMYMNAGAPFANASLNTSGKDLITKTYPGDEAWIEACIDSLAAVSTSAVNGSNGIPGVVVSTTIPSKQYLLSANGVDYAEWIEKGIMGAVFYYQATAYYLSDAQIGDAVDNTVVTPGEGTAMEHHWDEAFGYFCVPADFPADLTALHYWGKYCNTTDALLQGNRTMMNAFLSGRAAISNKDMDTKNEQVIILRNTWDKLAAAAAIHYLNEAVETFSDEALRCHALSEATAFIRLLKYNPVALADASDIAGALDAIGPNFYTCTTTGILQARDQISAVYALDSVKDQL